MMPLVSSHLEGTRSPEAKLRCCFRWCCVRRWPRLGRQDRDAPHAVGIQTADMQVFTTAAKTTTVVAEEHRGDASPAREQEASARLGGAHAVRMVQWLMI